MKTTEILILSGLSGSGKSSALHILEDLGFFAIDNFPSELLPPLLKILSDRSGLSPSRRLALGMDVRETSFVRRFEDHMRLFRQKKFPAKIFFFDARDDVLIRRFSETRRRHPLAPRGRVSVAIQKEREMLHPVRAMASRVIDTSMMNVHDLQKALTSLLAPERRGNRLSINLISFGYRFGLPLEADLVLDLRFLPNPYFVPALKSHSGRNRQVRRFVLQKKETQEFLKLIRRMLKTLLRNYQKEGKSYLTIALGCTGGRHRSVVLTESLSKDLKKMGYPANIVHRDILQGA